ncbi:hypothetical protein B0T26DRAFT_676259 [Lasiosphaeria miniovina]|uniref:Major facilitator superfamily (MFS) profile domain-containing protein n=1 Tax=Lasiosphaeria miniovina TaxID=1954250 RepID=A0AA40E0D0_9PEZI|nr:uncharacterized protein B0T26DRAFT_676259 [Lasiosphaeria miniovina]KAK0718038.1 hypothetical protein B0T26DRAFT_676259 [Lasiosphaeria miniovina]
MAQAGFLIATVDNRPGRDYYFQGLRARFQIDAMRAATKPKVSTNDMEDESTYVYHLTDADKAEILAALEAFKATWVNDGANKTTMGLCLYQILQATAPLFLGDLSDGIGRWPVYVLSFLIYLGANIGLAMQHSYGAILVLRALQNAGCSATVAIGSAVIADFTTPADRGGYTTAAV